MRIYSIGFFVQSILADRYIHNRELRIVSLKTASSIEYGIKRIFFIFVLYRESLRFKVLRIVIGILLFFFFTFPFI